MGCGPIGGQRVGEMVWCVSKRGHVCFMLRAFVTNVFFFFFAEGRWWFCWGLATLKPLVARELPWGRAEMGCTYWRVIGLPVGEGDNCVGCFGGRIELWCCLLYVVGERSSRHGV